MYETAADAIALAEHDTAVRVVMFAGMPGVFTAGHDVDDLRRYADSTVFGESPIRFMKTAATLDKPIVAAVDGLAMGIGTTMLFHCDFVVASEWSIFSSPFADLGLPPEAGASLLAPGIMGYHRAFELMVMGEQFDAHRALTAGLSTAWSRRRKWSRPPSALPGRSPPSRPRRSAWPPPHARRSPRRRGADHLGPTASPTSFVLRPPTTPCRLSSTEAGTERRVPAAREAR